MARVPYLDREHLPEDYRHLFDKNMSADGRVSNLFRALAHSPRLMHQFMRLGHDLRKRTRLDATLRELVILTVCRVTGNTFEFFLHLNGAREAGLSDRQLIGLSLPECYPGFTDEQRAVMRYAEEVTRNIRVSDATFDAVRAFLSDEEIVELTLLTGYYNLVARFLEPLQVRLDEAQVRQQLPGD
jgi:alkylhydroperoxidase family enzyme